ARAGRLFSEVLGLPALGLELRRAAARREQRNTEAPLTAVAAGHGGQKAVDARGAARSWLSVALLPRSTVVEGWGRFVSIAAGHQHLPSLWASESYMI